MTSQLDWYKLIFMTELLIITGLFTYKLKKRKLFAFRLAGSISVCYAAAFFFPVLTFNAWYTSFMFLFLFVAVLGAIKLCFDTTWLEVLYSGITSYTTRHLAYVLYNLIITISGLAESGNIGSYLNISDPGNDHNEWSVFTYFVTYYVVYWLAYLILGTRIKKNEKLEIGNILLLYLSIVIILVEVIFNAVIIYHSAENFDKLYVVISYLYASVSCSLVIVIQFGLLGKKQLQRELYTTQTLRHKEQKQYLMSKDVIDQINLKCHDLKHQISALRGRIDEDELAEIEKAVMLYDSYIKTGHPELDVMLTEKNLICEKNRIQFICRVDKSDLSFMSVADEYSLFGNALDNAIEAVMKVEDESQRSVNLSIKTSDRLLSIHIDNSYSGEINFKGNLPETTKKDKIYHGFGMKSIKHITEKYGGNLIARVDKKRFKLDIMFPR